MRGCPLEPLGGHCIHLFRVKSINVRYETYINRYDEILGNGSTRAGAITPFSPARDVPSKEFRLEPVKEDEESRPRRDLLHDVDGPP